MSEPRINYFNRSNAVSLISATTGVLEITKIPVTDQPDWIIPQTLILAIDDYQDRIWTYIWKNQEVSIYHLLPREIQPEKIVVVESITDAHRIGLQIQGEITFHSIKLTDLRDVTPEELQNNEFFVPAVAQTGNEVTSEAQTPVSANLAPTVTPEQDFVFQPVMFQGELCVVPDLDKLSHYLVDLDS